MRLFIHKIFIIAILPILLGFLGGCASFYDFGAETDVPSYHVPKHIASAFSIDGRFSVNSKDNHSYGNFVWNRHDGNDGIDFKTPLGATVANVTVESGVATLTMNDKVYVGDELNQVLAKQIGFNLPLSYLHYWVQGVADPSDKFEPLADGFRQNGWKIEYLDWLNDDRPRIIKCSKGDIVAKLLIHW